MKRSTVFFPVLIAGITLSLAAMAIAQAKPLKIIHNFTGGSDGNFPVSGVIFDSAGNLYGTTFWGGSGCGVGCGLVYKLTPTGRGGWTESPVYLFDSEDTGIYPVDLLFGPDGNLYGIDDVGGTSRMCLSTQDCQIVFQLSPTSTNWKEKVLKVFGSGPGAGSSNGLVADAAGNLYGTGGGGCCGVVFRLSPFGAGGWKETVLYSFSGAPDGYSPFSKLIFDAAGNLYGTTVVGGSNNIFCHKYNGCGVVFELSPTASGTWTETVLYTFHGPDGAFPFSGLAFDSAGNLYGTTEYGGKLTDCVDVDHVGCGVVFKLSPSGSGWTETVLHAFTGGGDGGVPITAVTLDAAGNLYGGTVIGGKPSTTWSNGSGVIFKLAPNSTGGWVETVLHTFNGSDGEAAEGVPLTWGPDGNLYGTVANGGTGGHGVVFSIAP
jgi:uncharacterized repeat protein (TIGR03803 family)